MRTKSNNNIYSSCCAPSSSPVAPPTLEGLAADGRECVSRRVLLSFPSPPAAPTVSLPQSPTPTASATAQLCFYLQPPDLQRVARRGSARGREGCALPIFVAAADERGKREEGGARVTSRVQADSTSLSSFLSLFPSWAGATAAAALRGTRGRGGDAG